MDLHSGACYWPMVDGLGLVVPPLERDVECDVVIVGAGITGALVADALVAEGLSVVVVDRRDVGQGSTAASTALLQYDIDVPLHRLREKIGAHAANRAYLLGVEAIASLETLGREVGCAVERRPSMYFTTDAEQVGPLVQELEARLSIGLAVGWIGADALRAEWGLRAAGAIRSTAAAQTDPFRLCQELLRRAVRRGAAVHDRTMVTDRASDGEGVALLTDRGAELRARWMVHATGYESARELPRGVVSLHSTYALVTEPLLPSPGQWLDRCLMWEFAEPYLYMRWAGDRLMMGGADLPFRNEKVRDRLIGKRTKAVAERAGEILPELALEPAFVWTGTFGSTKDGLGYIGAMPDRPRELFALGFGGNGITYSAIASKILADHVLGRANADADLFRFGR